MIAQKHLDRFWHKVDVREKNKCWEWLAGEKGKGYGQFGYKGKSWLAHRFSWLLHNGKIPEGMCVCRTCDNPGCVNPAHLFLGTNKDNLLDASRKGRMANQKGEVHGRSKLTEEQVLAIRAEYKTGNISQAELARKYNVSQSTIGRVVNRKSWRHI